MRFLYQISLYLYSFTIRIAGLFNSKAKAWHEGRKTPLWESLNVGGKSVVWFHCASLGEFDIGLPLMEAWKKMNPDDFILVTFFSPSGMQNYHKREHPADAVDYISLDTPSNAKKFIAKIQPKTVFFVKYEFWAFHLFEAKKSGSKIYSVNTLFRENQLYFKPYGSFYRRILKTFDHFFVQNEKSIQLLKSISINNASISGDLRFDRVFQNKNRCLPIPQIENWLQGEKAFVIGSSWPKDEAILNELINDKDFNQKVILAPHEINESHIIEIEKKLKKKSIRFLDINENSVVDADTQVLILNTIGHLTNSFQYGTFAYIGGAFSGKLHNILEPAVFGLPIFFGPEHSKFPEADLFIEKGFGFEIFDLNSFKKEWAKVQNNKEEINERLLRFMNEQVGIADKIMLQLNTK
jgi:3-deoxy-D-manno-octulosonic-acid transferase